MLKHLPRNVVPLGPTIVDITILSLRWLVLITSAAESDLAGGVPGLARETGHLHPLHLQWVQRHSEQLEVHNKIQLIAAQQLFSTPPSLSPLFSLFVCVYVIIQAHHFTCFHTRQQPLM